MENTDQDLQLHKMRINGNYRSRKMRINIGQGGSPIVYNIWSSKYLMLEQPLTLKHFSSKVIKVIY